MTATFTSWRGASTNFASPLRSVPVARPITETGVFRFRVFPSARPSQALNHSSECCPYAGSRLLNNASIASATDLSGSICGLTRPCA